MITGVAFLHRDSELLLSMPKPNRHNNIFHAFSDFGGNIVKMKWMQGFVDEHGKFYDRHQAAKHVVDIGQELTNYAKAEYENRTIEILFSEDVW